MSFGKIQFTEDPVSYTHLDVYKRQVYKYDKNERRTVLNPQEYTNNGAFNETLRGDSVNFGGSWSNADFSSDTTALGLDFGCLLYTSRYSSWDFEAL